MISSVMLAGATLKLGTRAMMALEAQHEKSVPEILQDMQEGGFSVTKAVGLLSVIMDDGRGATQVEAIDLVDQVGAAAAMDAINKAVIAAFPEAEASGDDGADTCASAESEAPGKRKRAA